MKERPPPTKVRGRLAGALVALAFGLLLVAGLEGALRLLGLGRAPAHASRLRYQRLVLPALVEDERPDGAAVWRTADPRLAFRTIARPKPPGTLRLVAFGGSATAGLGYSPNLAFPRLLERMLREALPGREVEVLNLGIVAMAVKQEQALVAEACARYEPDALIVYAGNNEFLELHADKYADVHGSVLQRAGAALGRLHLAQLLRQALEPRGRAAPADGESLASWEAAHAELRLTQAEIIRDVEVSEEEIGSALDRYEENLTRMARAARASGVPLVLCTVASNWRWRGRADLPADWMAQLAGSGDSQAPRAPDPPGELVQRTRQRLEARLAAAAPNERHELLYRRAVLAESEGDFAAAARDFRAAMNADPHLRRALDGQNVRVAEVAARESALFLDVVELLRAQAEHGIVGFDEFYDYVHFTPRGALLVAAGLLSALESHGLVTLATPFDAEAWSRAFLEDLAARETDYAEVDRWLGFSFERALLGDRDLWKYDRMLVGLDELLAREPANALARVFRANARSFRLDGAAGAEADYRAALEAAPGFAAAEAGLARLLAERVP